MLTNEEFQALLAKIKADPKSVTPAEFKTYMRCLRGDAYYDDPDIPFVNLTRLDTLREKAVNDRASITDEEKLFILGWPSRQEIVVNVSRATRSEYTPSQLLEKAVSDPESLKLWEASILVDKFHYRTAVDWDAIPKLLAVKRQEREAQHRAEQAVLTETEKMAMGNAHRLLRQLHEVSRGASDGVKPDPISREAVEATRSLDRYERMWKEADDEARRETLKSPTPWVQWIKDEGEPWGFALFRSEDAKGRAEYDRVYEDSIAFGLTSILGGSEILESKVLQVVETSCRDGDHAALRETFKALRTAGLQSGVLQSPFLLATTESMQAIPLPNPEDLQPWVWVYDPDWEGGDHDDEITIDKGGKHERSYDGCVKVAWRSVFSSLYPELLEGTRDVATMWIEAQLSRNGVWDTASKDVLERGKMSG